MALINVQTATPLRDYQIDLLERGRARHREGAKHVLFQAATGAGKTHIESEIARCAWIKGKRVLLVAHRRKLVTQISQRLDDFGVPHGIIMSGAAKTPAPVQVVSKDTLLSRGVRNEWMELPPADLLIVDEARNMLSDEYLSLIEKYGGAFVDGFDATPARSDGKGMGDFYEALEVAIPTSKLVEQGYLVPVRCFAPDRMEKTEKGKARKTKGLAGSPVEHWKRLAAGRPTVLFASKVETSLAACQAFIAAGVPAAHIDADTADEDRDRIIGELEDGLISVVCNCGIWTEGVDIPQLSCCILYRAAQSYVFFAQAVGRIMRAHPSKTDAILIDHSGAVFQHGFPDEDVEWSLDTSESVDSRVKTAKDAGKRREPICCPNCAAMFSGKAACPNCGKPLPRSSKSKAELREDELLTEVRRQRGDAQSFEDKERYWNRCLAIMYHKGLSVGAASHMYRNEYGEWPASDFRNYPERDQWKSRVCDVFPNFGKRGART